MAKGWIRRRLSGSNAATRNNSNGDAERRNVPMNQDTFRDMEGQQQYCESFCGDDWQETHNKQRNNRNRRYRLLVITRSLLLILGLVGAFHFVRNNMIPDDLRSISLEESESYSPPPISGHSTTTVSSTSSIKTSTTTSSNPSILQECGIWMAPSSLLPYPGFGIFTTRNIKYEESILHSPDAVSIPLLDMRRRKGVPLKEQRSALWNKVFGNYVWNRGVPDHSRYLHPIDMVDFQPGFGSLPNHHCLLASLGEGVAPTDEYPPYSDGLLFLDDNHNNSKSTKVHYGESPGTGAFSYTLGRDFYATRELQAGEEIFLNYGHCERDPETIHKEESWMQDFIYPEDIREASRIIKKYQPFGSKSWPDYINFDNGGQNHSTEILRALQADDSNTTKWENANPRHVVSILSGLREFSTRQRLLDSVNEIYTQSKESVLHSMGHRLAKQRYSYGRIAANKLYFEVAKTTLASKGKTDPEWIKQNGYCLENLIPKKSTLPDAGFGGFAQFGIKKGGIVVPAPVLHVVNNNTLTLYRRDLPKGVYPEDDLEAYKLGMGLLVNYCFGHPDSSMLMCPMTSAMLINHCSDRTKKCGPNGPNAIIQWSSGWDKPSHSWRNKTLDEIEQHTGRILSLEVVALRDIAPHDEVFIDYGIEWELAWEKHVQAWTPPQQSANFISVQEANQRKGPILPELISGDLRKTVDHPYLFVGCQFYASEDDQGGNFTKKIPHWENLSNKEILEKYAVSGSEFGYDGKEGYVDHHEHSHWPCSILYPEDEEGRYTVRIHQSPLRGVEPATTAWHENNLPRILTNYSQDAMHYFVKPSAQDHHLPNVFRQPIGLPKNLFPEQWKNLAQK